MTSRKCGGCTLCCKLLPVPELDKPANTRCRHQSHKGCGVYRAVGFPAACAVWNCRWLVGEGTGARPDRAGYVVDIMPDMIVITSSETGERHELVVMQVWVDPVRPNAWRDPALMRFAERQAVEHGEAMVVRFGTTRAIAVVAPSFWEDGQWRIVENGEIVASLTGSLLLDRIAAQEGSHG
jgi:hypothetical protein